MERFQTIIKKEFLHIIRDARTLGLILALPAILLILLGYGVSGEIKNIPIAVADLSKTDTSRRYVEYYTVSGDFSYKYDVLSEEEIIALIDQEKVKAGLLIPENFGRAVDTGEPVSVQFYINGSADPNITQAIQLKLSAISQIASQNILIEQIKAYGSNINIQNPINYLTRLLYNPNGDSGLFMIPGLIPIILQVQALLLSALSIVKEREQGTMEQLIVTPIKSWELMLGKMVPYLLVSVINTFALIFLGQLMFGIVIAGSFWELIGLSMIFIIGSLGMGVLISNISQSQMQAMYMAVFIVLIPAIILSGLLFPRDDMPAVTYWFSELMPVTHYLEITRSIILKGVGGAAIWPSILPLIILSIAYFTASILVFRKRI